MDKEDALNCLPFRGAERIDYRLAKRRRTFPSSAPRGTYHRPKLARDQSIGGTYYVRMSGGRLYRSLAVALGTQGMKLLGRTLRNSRGLNYEQEVLAVIGTVLKCLYSEADLPGARAPQQPTKQPRQSQGCGGNYLLGRN